MPSGRHATPGTAGLSPARRLFTPDTADLHPISPIRHAQRPVAGLSLLQPPARLNRDRPSVGLPGMLCAMRVHCLLAFPCLGHYHAIVEGPRWGLGVRAGPGLRGRLRTGDVCAVCVGRNTHEM